MDKPGKRQDSEYLSTLERGLSVLRAFDHSHPEMQLSEVAAKTGLSPAVARRCLNTLVQLGYVAQHGRKFLLRPEVLVFGSAYLASMNIEQVAGAPLQKVRDETGDSASMAVMSGHDILYLVHVSTNRRIRLGAGVGTRFPAYATSLGKVLLAFGSEEGLEEYFGLGELAPMTQHTITSAKALRDHLMDVRADGFASTQDELDYGIVSVAVPIFDTHRQVAAAINCSTSTTRISREELVKTRVPLLREAAREIEDSLRRWPFLSHSLRQA